MIHTTVFKFTATVNKFRSVWFSVMGTVQFVMFSYVFRYSLWAFSLRTLHVQTQLQITSFKLTWISVRADQFSKSKRILLEGGSIYHLPWVKIWKVVKIYRKSLMKMTIMKMASEFSAFSSAKI